MGNPELYLLDGWLVIPAWSVWLVQEAVKRGEQRAVEMLRRIKPPDQWCDGSCGDSEPHGLHKEPLGV